MTCEIRENTMTIYHDLSDNVKMYNLADNFINQDSEFMSLLGPFKTVENVTRTGYSTKETKTTSAKFRFQFSPEDDVQDQLSLLEKIDTVLDCLTKSKNIIIAFNDNNVQLSLNYPDHSTQSSVFRNPKTKKMVSYNSKNTKVLRTDLVILLNEIVK